jgi:hypothetical protein
MTKKERAKVEATAREHAKEWLKKKGLVSNPLQSKKLNPSN